MALTDSQRVDIRRWAGYGLVGNDTLAVYSDPAYSHTGPAYGLNSLTLTQKLDNLTTQEEEVLIAQFLTPLATLEAGILSSADNMDTVQAGPWKANPQEVEQRTSLYNKWRRQMCNFLGIQAGPNLGDGGITLVRC